MPFVTPSAQTTAETQSSAALVVSSVNHHTFISYVACHPSYEYTAFFLILGSADVQNSGAGTSCPCTWSCS